jgi:hypothetical protein
MPFSLSKLFFFFFPFISTSHCGLQCPLNLKALFEVLVDINFVPWKCLKSKKEMALEGGGGRDCGGSFVMLF